MNMLFGEKFEKEGKNEGRNKKNIGKSEILR
jgi:hypothetical protein